MKLNHPGLLLMPATQYHADRAIGHSGIVKMLKSPAHLREYLDHPHMPTPAMAFGTAVHTFVLEQERFADEFVVAEKFDRRTKEGKEAAARFEEANQGKALITSEEMDTLTEFVPPCIPTWAQQNCSGRGMLNCLHSGQMRTQD